MEGPKFAVITGKTTFEKMKTIYDEIRGHFREGIEVTTDDRVVTLSTCIGGQPNNRLLVLGVLTKEL